jgi:hypothetical protein
MWQSRTTFHVDTPGAGRMNLTQIQCLLVLSALAVIGFGPVSLTCLIGMHVVLTRPPWFFHTVRKLYADNRDTDTALRCENSLEADWVRVKAFLSLLFLLILDIAPVPVTGFVGLCVAAFRPAWFKALVERMYRGRVSETREDA